MATQDEFSLLVIAIFRPGPAPDPPDPLDPPEETVDAALTIGDITVGLRPGFSTIYNYVVAFTYITGTPAATAFVLTSPDGLTGTFSPGSPEGSGLQLRNANLQGTIGPVVIPPGQSIRRRATITVVQA